MIWWKINPLKITQKMTNYCNGLEKINLPKGVGQSEDSEKNRTRIRL